MVNLKYCSLTIIFLSYFKSNSSKCMNEPYGLHCANLINSSELTTFGQKNETLTNITTSVFLRNISSNIDNKVFTNFPILQHIDIQLSRIKLFSPNLTSLHFLYIIKNVEFPNIDEEFFEKCCRNLTTLIINDNRNLTVVKGAFKSVPNLEHLTITNQNIKCLTKAYLEGINKITYLNLAGNNLTEISPDSFEDLQNMNHLILSNNKISNFQENTFKNLYNLQNLELLNLDVSSPDKNVFKNQKELRLIGIPTKWINEGVSINNLTRIFSNLENIGIRTADKNQKDVEKFIESCKYTGFTINFLEEVF
ncbi:leucine-rich repeat-containing protein 15-like [Diorhabda carinulata]|uniref:leucine-rich repeat-containing protein 15-like n=1 Tax=Diorhabda carinulata TaxID=1163345 RepID=UPI0025A2D1FD|nr:leucine-rich repeat-containing protein 15-like [Diorhabda carinulata]